MAQGVDILIATPGRLTDLVREREVNLAETRWLVLDEADRMLDMGFIHDVKRIAKATHRDRQTALFSATMPPEIQQLAEGLLKDPIRVEVAPQGTTAAEIQPGRGHGAHKTEAPGPLDDACRPRDELGDHFRTHKARCGSRHP